MIKTMWKVIAALVLLVPSMSAQEALGKAETELKEASARLRVVQQRTAQEEGPMVEEVQTLDEEVLLGSKELRRRLVEEQSIGGKQKRLDAELASRRGEFEYTTNTLDGYAKGLLNRLQGAEIQLYQDRITGIRQNADAVQGDLSEEVKTRLKAVRVGAERLKVLAGGANFEGQAVAASGDIAKGGYAVIGPVAYFASSDGAVNGMTALNVGSLGLPQISEFEGEAGAQVSGFLAKGSGTVLLDATGGKAIEAKKIGKGAADYIDGGGVVGYGILALGLVAGAIALFKFFEIRFFPLPSRKTINVLLDDLLADRADSAAEGAADLPGMAGEMVCAGVEHFHQKRRVLEDALLEKLSAIQPRLDRLLPFLALVAAAAPMMGLLGTVLGIMKTFDMMAVFGTGNAKNFSAGIGEALITTAMGLVVAIPVLVIHGLLKSMARGKFDQAQGVALAILNGTTELETKGRVEKVEDEDPEAEEEDFEELELQNAG